MANYGYGIIIRNGNTDKTVQHHHPMGTIVRIDKDCGDQTYYASDCTSRGLEQLVSTDDVRILDEMPLVRCPWSKPLEDRRGGLDWKHYHNAGQFEDPLIRDEWKFYGSDLICPQEEKDQNIAALPEITSQAFIDMLNHNWKETPAMKKTITRAYDTVTDFCNGTTDTAPTVQQTIKAEKTAAFNRRAATAGRWAWAGIWPARKLTRLAWWGVKPVAVSTAQTTVGITALYFVYRATYAVNWSFLADIPQNILN